MRILSFIICFLLSVSATAQIQYITRQPTKAELDARRKEIQQAINETEEQLAAIKNNKKATMGELSALQNKLSLRQRQISNINEELDDINKTIRSSSKEIGSMKQKLDQLKVRYAQSIRYAYETRSSYDMLAFLFSSHDFNDAMRRMKYLKKFREFRKAQVEQIRSTQTQLQQKIGTLKKEQVEQDELLKTQVQEKQVLLKETEKTNEVIQELKGKESELMKQISKHKKEADRLNRMITEVIERAMRQAEEEARKKAAAVAAATPGNPAVKPGTTPTTTAPPVTAPTSNVPPRVKPPKAEAPELLLTPTDVALASNFEGNKGKLYWPVEKGYITDHFGTHPHPVYTKVMVNNTGIDIQTTPNATVKAVFEGTVSAVMDVEGVKCIIVQHGNYFSVYNNLASTSIGKGAHVSTNQAIGNVANNDDGDPVIKFQIWKSGGKKSSTNLNPESWLGRAR